MKNTQLDSKQMEPHAIHKIHPKIQGTNKTKEI